MNDEQAGDIDKQADVEKQELELEQEEEQRRSSGSRPSSGEMATNDDQHEVGKRDSILNSSLQNESTGAQVESEVNEESKEQMGGQNQEEQPQQPEPGQDTESGITTEQKDKVVEEYRAMTEAETPNEVELQPTNESKQRAEDFPTVASKSTEVSDDSAEEKNKLKKARMAELMRKQQAKAAAKAGANASNSAPNTTPSQSLDSISALKKYLGSDARAALVSMPKSELPIDLGSISKFAIELFRAARAGDIAQVKQVHNSFEADFDTPLKSPQPSSTTSHDEANKGTLIEGKYDPNFIDANVGPRGATPLIAAVQTAVATNTDGASSTSHRAEGSSASKSTATASGASQIIEYLLKCKANPNVCDFAGTSPLIIAAARGHSQLVRDLLRAGADPTHCDENGWTALTHSTHQGFSKISSDLVRAFAKPVQNNNNGAPVSQKSNVEQVM